MAGHVNQLLGSHEASIVYQGTQTAAQTTNGATTTSTNGLWLAQSFTTAVGQTMVGAVTVSLTTTTTTGALLPTTTVSIYADSAGAPSGSPLVSTTLTAEYAYAASGGVTTTRILIPLPVIGLTAGTTYWIVATAAGNVSDSYTWHRSDQVSGASTSPDGTTWTAQGYGFTFTVTDLSATSSQVATWEDGGARWTATTYTGADVISSYAEYTAGQTAAGYLQSYRTFTYSGGLLTGVS